MTATGICRWLFLLISLSTWTKLIDSKEMRIVCYYTNWSVYRPGQAKFSPQNINPYLCTHLVYAFGGFTKENTFKPFDKYQDIEKGGYAKFTGLKTYNKNLKTLIAIGGWNEGSSRFSPMVASADRRKELVKNAIKFLRQNHFDGLDLDWEYPTFRDGGKPRDRDNYAQLVKELREEFERESEKTGRPRLLLTMAVPAGIEYINKGYDVPKLTKYLDWMNILSYDFHSAFEPAVNHHAPLFSLEEDNEYNYDAELNIDYMIKHYLKLGADPTKLVLGIPTYGRSYTLFNPDANEIGAPADGPGDMGEATRENGYLAYYEICEYIKDQDWEVVQPNPEAMGPYAFKGNQWVGYDDEDIVRRKAKYVVDNGLGGIMFWAIDNDDFRGNCHGKPYPLIEAGKEAMIEAYGITDDNLISPPAKPTKPKTKSKTRPSLKSTTPKSEEVSVSTTRRRRIKQKSRDEDKLTSASSPKRRKQSTTTSTHSSLKIATPSYTTPAPPSTPDVGGAFKCEDEGFFAHPKDCKKYFWCLAGAGDNGIVAHQFTCPAGLYFNKAADSCDYTQNVLCNKKLQKAASTTTTTTTEQAIVTTTTSNRATTRRLFRQSTTTTEAPEYEDDEYEDEEETESDRKGASEEDPKVIKELIDLIRKAGGIEELERQLKIDKNATSSSVDTTTQSVISKSLYERVLSKTSKNTLNALRKSTTRNSSGPQSDGLKSEKNDRSRPQYKTLTRQRTVSDDQSSTESAEEATRSFKAKNSLEYVNIRRAKSSTTTESSEDSGFNRNKILGELDEEDEEEEEEEVEDTSKRTNVPKYVNIRRQRPSTTEDSATAKYVTISRVTTTPESESTERYKTIRRGTTTESGESVDEITRKYQTISRSTTTPSSVTSESDDGSVNSRTAATASSVDDENDVTSKYQTISRSTSTQSTTTLSTERGSSSQRTEAANASETTGISSTVPPRDNLNTVNVTESIKDSDRGSDSTETNVLKVKRRPVLFQPRPFSTSTESTTEATKVSQSNFKFRLRQNSPSSTTEATTTRIRTRGGSRFSNRNINEDSSADKDENVHEKQPTRTRKRVVVTTEKTVDYNQEQIRTYRPAELADLSSLTAVDLNLRGGEFVSSHRRRRPVTSTTSLGRNKNVKADDQIDASSEISATTRGIRSTTSKAIVDDVEAKSTPKFAPRTRKIIRKFRPTTESTLTTVTSESPSTAASNFKLRRRIPVFKQRLNEVENVQKNSTTSSPLLKLFSTRPGRLPFGAQNDTGDAENEHTDILNGEEGENIKLSESNIRESSQLNAFDAEEKPRKSFSKFNRPKTDIEVSSFTQSPPRGTFPTFRSTEATVPLRTRKIVRKLTTEATVQDVDGKKRKVVRRLRPSNINSLDSKAKDTTEEPLHPHNLEVKAEDEPSIEHTTESSSPVSSRLSVYTRPSSTTTETTEFDQEEDEEEYSDDELEDGEEPEPKFIKYTSSSINRSHHFESNTNFDNEDEEDHDEGLTENKSITSSILKSAMNSLNQSETIINKDEDESSSKRNDLFHTQKDRPTFRQKIAISKEEIQSKMQNTVNTRPSYNTISSTTTEVESTTDFELFTTESTTILDASTLSTGNDEDTSIIVTTTESDSTTIEPNTSGVYELSPTTTDETLNKTETTTKPAEASTANYRRSTLRSVQERPKFNPKRFTSTTESSLKTTSARKSSFGRNKLRQTSTTSKPTRLFTTRARTPINRQLYRTSTTTEQPPLDDEDDDVLEDEPEVPKRTNYFKAVNAEDDQKPRVVNAHVDVKKSKPIFSKPTTEETVIENLGIDTEAVRNRNKNLFSKRKMNTPFAGTSTTTGADFSVTTESTDVTEQYSTTLQHVFAELAEVTTTDLVENATESVSSIKPGKVERLIEVNRIVEVKTKEAKVKNHAGVVEEATEVKIIPTLDKIGEITRITVIKVVDGNNETIIETPETNEIGKASPVEEARVLQVSPLDGGSKIEILGTSKVTNEKVSASEGSKPLIIDGLAHINVVTAKPLVDTETSTISLEKLFQSGKTNLNPSFTSNDEVLETDRSEFVNVRVLNQEQRGFHTGLKGVSIIPQDHDTHEAKVVEITPKPSSRTIKIVPIRVEMTKNLANIRIPKSKS